jgi:hypothetical protein
MLAWIPMGRPNRPFDLERESETPLRREPTQVMASCIPSKRALCEGAGRTTNHQLILIVSRRHEGLHAIDLEIGES